MNWKRTPDEIWLESFEPSASGHSWTGVVRYGRTPLRFCVPKDGKQPYLQIDEHEERVPPTRLTVDGRRYVYLALLGGWRAVQGVREVR